MKIKGKTRDGVKISKIIKGLGGLEGIAVRDGKKHKTVLVAQGLAARRLREYNKPLTCPVAPSSDYGSMIAPWVAAALGENKRRVYKQIGIGYC